MSRKGSQKLAVFLCKFSDNTAEPHPVDFYKQLFALRGTGALNDYWNSASLGAINLDGTEVFGWRTIDQKKADFLAARPSRWDKVKGAIDAFPEVDTSKYSGVVAMYNVDLGDSGTQGGVLASPGAMSVTFLAHETGHVFGLEHSFDQSSRKDATWSAPGEYFDMHDIMSAMNVYNAYDSKFLEKGPLLCAANMDRMGWLPAARTWSIPTTNSSWSDEFDLVSLGHPEIPGFVAAKASGFYLEFRTMDNKWDAAIPRPCVLIHKMVDPNAVVMASDPQNFVNDWQPGQTFGATDMQLAVMGGTQIKIKSFDLPAKKARIGVRVVSKRVYVAGPGKVFGGVASDGGGWIIVNGRIIPVPPRSPFVGVLEAIANVAVNEAQIGEIAGSLGIQGF